MHADVISIEVEDPDRSLALELAMQWTTAYSESVHSYANTVNTHEGGTHEEGFRAALTKLVNDFARKQNQLKDKDENLTGDDVREGLTAVISVKLGEPQFEGQTKTKLGNSEVKGFVQSAMTDEFGAWLDSHPNEGREIVRKAIQASAARMAARKAREATRKRVLESRRPARQAARLPGQGPRRLRGVHRRGRLGRWLGRAWPQPAQPGDPARSAARSSTSSGRASTRPWATRRCRR